MTCIEGCRTFLWGGNGLPEFDSEGRCFCSCEDGGWSDHNVLGLPACVPVKAHLVFGCVGLVLSVAAFCHAAYHLRRQLRFHERHQSASISAVERCRRELHIAVVAVSTLHISYCCMVIADEFRHSVAVLGVAQIPISISAAVLVTRMWIYTNDPVLMRKSPEVLRICRWLETLAGHRVAYGLVSISPVCAIVLDLNNHPETAMKVIAAGVIFLCGICMPTMFWMCGRSLIRAIDESIQQQQQQEEPVSGQGHERRESKHNSLLRAKKKVQTIVLVAFFVCGKVTGLLVFAVCSKYGTTAPLLVYAPPMVVVPPLWNILHVQLHAARTKLDSDGDGLTTKPLNIFSLSRISIWHPRILKTPATSQVIPFEASH